MTNYKNYLLTLKNFRILEYLDSKHLNFSPILDIIAYLKDKIKPMNKLTEESYIIQASIPGFTFLLRDNYILLENGMIDYTEKETGAKLKKEIKDNRLSEVNRFTIKLLIKNNWRMRLNQKIKPIIPIIQDYFIRRNIIYSGVGFNGGA